MNANGLRYAQSAIACTMGVSGTKIGAIPTNGKVVIDHNRITAGPLTCSIDAAVVIVQNICGDDVAREMELHRE